MDIRKRHQNEFRRLRSEAFLKQNGLCYWCSEQMNEGAPDSDPRQLTGEHIIPLSNGGMTDVTNIVATCRECNSLRDVLTQHSAIAGNPDMQ